MMEIFIVETTSFLDKIEAIMMDNEGNSQGIIDSVGEIFRIMHTIKSSSAMMGLENVSKLAHTLEDLFFFIRENKPENIDFARLTDIVLEGVSFIKENISGKPEGDPASLTQAVKKFLEELKNPAAPAESKSPQEAAPDIAGAKPLLGNQQAENEKRFAELLAETSKTSFIIYFKDKVQMLGLRAFELQSKLAKLGTKLMTVPDSTDEKGEKIIAEQGFSVSLESPKSFEELCEIIKKSPFVERVELLGGMPKEETPRKAPADEPAAAKSAQKAYANIPVSSLDYLVDLVGELIISEMTLRSSIETANKDLTGKSLASIQSLSQKMQELALSTRMVTLEDTFHKMKLLLRDICRKQNKDVNFITSGEKTEIDRALIDNLNAPLMHILRNSIDHGIENAAERLQKGKKEKGTVELSAANEGRVVVITIKDDGRGLDKDKILKKAIANGLIAEDAAKNLTDDEIYAFIFLPGFSTNTNVTEFSGRGVGMDVVHENIKKGRGKVYVSSIAGEGTKTVIRLPLTIAILDALILSSAGETCNIPVAVVGEIFKLSDENNIRTVNNIDVVSLRDELYQICNLNEFFGQKQKADYTKGVMLVLKNMMHKTVIFCDEVLSRQSVVVKPMPGILKSVRGFSGCTILGDGKVSLIVDYSEVVELLSKR